MNHYLFIFGNHPALSVIELDSVVQLYGFKVEINRLSAEMVEVKSSEPLQTDWWQAQLGGTVKIAKVKALAKESDLKNVIKDLCRPNYDKKFNFGISVYNLPNLKINNIGMEVKRNFANSDYKIRFVVSKEKILSSVIVKKNNLISGGAEFVLIKNKDGEVVVAITETVQDFAGFGERDYGRPAADGKNGMLPPKLAKMMINLAKCPQEGLLVDPFCGSGTVLQEALVLDYKNIHGSDLNEKVVEDCQRNINWLINKSIDKKTNIKGVEIVTYDALNISKKYKKNSIDAIVTEPYLGPVDKFAVLGQQKNIITELNDSYEQFIKQAYLTLKKGGRLVIVVPIILGQALDYKQWLDKDRFIEIFPASLPISLAKYSRFGQRVERLVLVLEKN